MPTSRSTNAPIRVAVVAAFLTTGIGIAAQQPPTSGPPSPPADLNAVIALLEGGDATPLQKKQLVRKWYTGTVTVEDVVAERPDSPAQLIVAVKKGSRGNQDNFIEMAFEITDVERAAKLKKGSQVTVTGQLVGTSVRKTRYMHIGDVEVFQFRNVTMAGQEQKPVDGPKATQPQQTASAQSVANQIAAAFEAPHGSVLLVRTDTGKHYGFTTGAVGDRTGAKLVLKSGAIAINVTASDLAKDKLVTELWNISDDRGPYFQSTFPDGSKLTGSVGRLVETETIQVVEVLASKACVPGGYVLPLWRCFAPTMR